MTDDLIAFLRARLDEDEQVAQACEGPTWVARPERDPDIDGWFPTDVVLRTASERTLWYDEGADIQEEAVHAARHDPARVLAEVEAKRGIIDYVASWPHDDPDDGGYYSCPLLPGSLRAMDDDWDGKTCYCGLELRQMAILGRLAQSYVGHEGYRQEWER